MKQAFLLFTTIFTIAGATWFNTNENLTQVDFFADAFTTVQPGQSLHANLYTENATVRKVACETAAQPGVLSCKIPAEYAGQEISLQFDQNGILYVYLVNIPA